MSHLFLESYTDSLGLLPHKWHLLQEGAGLEAGSSHTPTAMPINRLLGQLHAERTARIAHTAQSSAPAKVADEPSGEAVRM